MNYINLMRQTKQTNKQKKNKKQKQVKKDIRRQQNKQLREESEVMEEISNKEYIENKISDIIVEQAVENQWYGNCIPISIILSESFNKKSINNVIKKGLLHMDTEDNKFAMFHCWVETDNKKLNEQVIIYYS